MLHVDVTLEDVRIVATVVTDLEHLMRGKWNVMLFDNLSGRSEQRFWDGPQMAAVLAVAVDGESGTSCIEECVPLAGEACADLPQECRPIP